MEWRSDARGLSTLTEILLWGIVGLVALMVVMTLLSIAVSVAISVLTALVPILVLGAIIYLAVRYLSGDDEPAYGADDYGFGSRNGVDATGASDRAPQDPQDRLTEQYVRGEISEAEYERRLERHVDAPGDRSTGGSLDDLETDSSRARDRDRELR